LREREQVTDGYFEAVRPTPPLMGRDPKGKAIVAAAQRRAERDGFYALMESFRNFTPGMKGHSIPGPDGYEQIPALAERGRARVERFFETMEAELAGRAFVCGPRFQHCRHHHLGDAGFRQMDQAHGPGAKRQSTPLVRRGPRRPSAKA
jgi:glutathione S-transferase